MGFYGSWITRRDRTGADRWRTYLQEEREKYAGQMEGYARAFPGEEVRVGLWYPMLGRLEWWVV